MRLVRAELPNTQMNNIGEEIMSMMNGPMMFLMMSSMGLLFLLFLAVLILSLVTLVKYLRGPQ